MELSQRNFITLCHPTDRGLIQYTTVNLEWRNKVLNKIKAEHPNAKFEYKIGGARLCKLQINHLKMKVNITKQLKGK